MPPCDKVRFLNNRNELRSTVQTSSTTQPDTVQARPTAGGIGGITTTDISMLLVVIIWGANFSIVKWSLSQIPPLAFTALRFTFAAVLLLIVLRVREGTVRLPQDKVWRVLLFGFIGNTIYQVLFINGLAITTAANTALLIATTPVLVLLLGSLLRIEPLTRNTVAGIALAFIGMALVMAARGAGLNEQTLTGDLLALASAVCWSIYTLGVRSLGAELSPLRITAWTMVAGVPGLLVIGAGQLANTNWIAVDERGWGGLAYATLLALVVAYLLWNTSVRRVGSSRTAVYACATPLVATVVAWYVLGEAFKPLQGFGAALIVGGVLLTRKRAKTEAERARLLQEQVHTSASV
jgi:drug/metabolite transporter (DMT)-like permease